MNVLIIAGAGTSIELGVPSMVGLAEEFVEHSRQWDVEPELVGRILGEEPDIEHLIEELDHICSAKSSLQAIGETSIEFSRFDKVRAEVEWFIQHAAERVLPREAALVWAGVLRAAHSHRLTIVTTNYDRAIELAANSERVQVDDGFKFVGDRETAQWVGFSRSDIPIQLVKLHGSTDWYAEAKSGRPIKLRHPMPLFGRAMLQLPDSSRLGSALILPSREKLLTREPYPRLSQTFLNAIDSCELAVVVGSSLRDPHLRGAAQSVAQRVPTFVVNPEGSSLAVENAETIAATASAFLIGILPAALVTQDPRRRLSDEGRRWKSGDSGALWALKTALDPAVETRDRCKALDVLVDQGVVLDLKWMEELLGCSDPDVARYGLGLIPHSPQHERLVEVAASSAHCASSTAFLEDLALLREFTSPSADS